MPSLKSRLSCCRAPASSVVRHAERRLCSSRAGVRLTFSKISEAPAPPRFNALVAPPTNVSVVRGTRLRHTELLESCYCVGNLLTTKVLVPGGGIEPPQAF